MTKQCYVKKGLNQPVCGLHEVPLVEQETADNPTASVFGDFAYFICPVTKQVVSGTATYFQDSTEKFRKAFL
jgi:hypothetical protein